MELDNHTFEKEHIIFQTSIIRFHIARFLDCTPETNVYFHLLQKPASTAEATETRETQEARRDTQEGFEKCFNCICILFQDVLLRMILFMSLEFWCGLQKHRFSMTQKSPSHFKMFLVWWRQNSYSIYTCSAQSAVI